MNANLAPEFMLEEATGRILIRLVAWMRLYTGIASTVRVDAVLGELGFRASRGDGTSVRLLGRYAEAQSSYLDARNELFSAALDARDRIAQTAV